MTDFSAELELSGLMVVGTVGVDHRMAAVEEGEAEEVRRLFDTNYFGTVDMSGHNKFDVADTKMGTDGRSLLRGATNGSTSLALHVTIAPA